MRTSFKYEPGKQLLILELLELKDHPETGPP